MAKAIDLTGRRFGRLTVIGRDPKNYYHVTTRKDGTKKSNIQPRWICKCDCGTVKTVLGANLRKGATKSCGCITKERLKAQHAAKKAKGAYHAAALS